MNRAENALAIAVAVAIILLACSKEPIEDGPGGVSGTSGVGGNVAAGAGGASGAGGEVAGSGGAGGAGGAGGTGGTDIVDMETAKDPTTPLDRLPEACKGFAVLGLKHSPGGDTLPNSCAPFHNTLNNPYAVRCVDADPAYDTGYLGDELCILPPEVEKGTQVRVDPGDYADPATGFELQPGDEINNFYYGNATNDSRQYFYRVNIRMRPGSHHIINRILDQDRADGWSYEGDAGFDPSGNSRGFPGAQRPDEDRPKTLMVPAEQGGLGDVLLAKQQFSFNMHHFNVTAEPVLREVWINVWYKAESEVTDVIGGIAIFGNPLDVSIPNGEHRVLHYVCDVPGSTRILTLNGHRHASTDRFGVWLVREGQNIPLYESFEYSDMPTYQYDSISTNPTPNVQTQTDGAFSGILDVKQGDEIHFVCDITNRSGGSLRFANEVKTGEMCILFGSRTGDPLCQGYQQNVPQ